MIKKKFLICLGSLVGVATISGLIAAGYVTNNYSNSPYQYSSAPVSSSVSDLIQSYLSATVGGSKLLYLASYTHTTPLNNGLNISKSKNEAIYKYLGRTGFILIDDQFGLPKLNDSNLFDLTANQPIWSTNVAAVQFRADLGSFITGVALGQFLNEYQDYFADDGKLTWSTYGALPFPSVVSFMGGIQQGVEWFNKNIVPKQSGYKEVEQVFLGTNQSQNFAGSFDVTAGNDIINQLLVKNVDAIFPVGGPQVAQAVRLVRQSSKKTIVVGVDSAVEKDDSINLKLPVILSNQTIGYENKIVQFSSIKNIQSIANKVTQIINDPTIVDNVTDASEWEEIGGIGYSSLGTVNNSGVGVSDAGKPYFVRAMKIYSGESTDIDENNIDTLYKEATSTITSLTEFKKLNNSENKVYKVSDTSTYSYASIVNNGFEMLPIAESSDKISSWYDTTYANDETMLSLKTQNLALIQEWIANNSTTINKRKEVKESLVGDLNDIAWSKYHGVIKIMFQSPVNILFDSSFLESCYYGLRDYWLTVTNGEVNLPLPSKALK